jgi:hypothetical protein
VTVLLVARTAQKTVNVKVVTITKKIKKKEMKLNLKLNPRTQQHSETIYQITTKFVTVQNLIAIKGTVNASKVAEAVGLIANANIVKTPQTVKGLFKLIIYELF